MAKKQIVFDSPRAYMSRLAKRPDIAIIPYSMAAEILGVKVSTVQGYVRDRKLQEVVVVGEDRTWVSLLANEVRTERRRKVKEVVSRIAPAMEILLDTAKKGRTKEYAKGFMIPLDLDNKRSQDRFTLGKVLGRISRRTFRQDGLMLSVLAVEKATGRPNDVFFELARELGAVKPGESDEDFFQREKKAVLRRYGGFPKLARLAKEVARKRAERQASAG